MIAVLNLESDYCVEFNHMRDEEELVLSAAHGLIHTNPLMSISMLVYIPGEDNYSQIVIDDMLIDGTGRSTVNNTSKNEHYEWF